MLHGIYLFLLKILLSSCVSLPSCLELDFSAASAALLEY
jgi:starvation-inducible outer membrane lipoprotein